MFSCIIIYLGTCLARYEKRWLTKLVGRTFNLNFSCPLSKAGLIEKIMKDAEAQDKNFSKFMVRLIEDYCNKANQVKYEDYMLSWKDVLKSLDRNKIKVDFENFTLEETAIIQSVAMTIVQEAKDATYKKRNPFSKKPTAKATGTGIILNKQS
jgi:hypothetical protein